MNPPVTPPADPAGRPGHGDLERLQRAFAAALLDPAAVPADAEVAALVAQPGFAVYRNTVMTACIAALGDNHPTVRTLLGEEAFAAVAAAHVATQPPRDGRLAVYGERFPAFVARHPLGAVYPWLADVARLDRAWVEAHLAADATALQVDAVAALAPADLLGLPLQPHPAARLLHLDAPYAWAVWCHHRAAAAAGTSAGDLDVTEHDACTAALFTRPHDGVQWHAPDAAAQGLFALAERRAVFADALEALGEAAIPAFQALLRQGALEAR